MRGGNVVNLGGHLVGPLIDAVFGVFSLHGHEGLGQVIVHGVVSIGFPDVGVPVAGEGGAIRIIGIAENVGYRASVGSAEGSVPALVGSAVTSGFSAGYVHALTRVSIIISASTRDNVFFMLSFYFLLCGQNSFCCIRIH